MRPIGAPIILLEHIEPDSISPLIVYGRVYYRIRRLLIEKIKYSNGNVTSRHPDDTDDITQWCRTNYGQMV